MRYFLAILLALILTACASFIPPVSHAGQGDNILSIAKGQRWSFEEVDGAGNRIRTLVIEMTDESSSTCISGDWMRARVLSDPTHYTSKPAVLVSENRVELLLVNELCDAYDSYIFDTAAASGIGSHVAYGMVGGKDLAKFIARKLN